MGWAELGPSSEQGGNSVPPAALYSCHYPGEEDVQLNLPWGALAAPSPALPPL